MVRDQNQLLATLFSNISTVTLGLGELQAGEVFSKTRNLLPSAVPAFIRQVRSLDTLSQVGEGVPGPHKAVGTLVANVTEYIDDLAVPLGTVAAVLAPVTAPLRGVKADPGHWLTTGSPPSPTRAASVFA
jgi:phospholipid/cholesterol/gamma-HCH transport system substrate-binding protein